MAKNRKYASGRKLYLTVPGGVVSGDPVAVGAIPGVALIDRDASNKATVDTGGCYMLSVKGIDGSGNHAIAEGDKIYFVLADTPRLSAKDTGVLFGYALEAVGSGITKTIAVRLALG